MDINKMLNNTEVVKKILTKSEKARNDDDFLYEKVVNEYGISVETSLREIHNLVREKKLPSQATINRCRRKVQELYPELCASGEIAKLRHQEIPSYIKYNKIANKKI